MPKEMPWSNSDAASATLIPLRKRRFAWTCPHFFTTSECSVPVPIPERGGKTRPNRAEAAAGVQSDGFDGQTVRLPPAVTSRAPDCAVLGCAILNKPAPMRVTIVLRKGQISWPSLERERKMTESARSSKSTTRQAAKKASARPGPRADEADGESAVLATIAAMPGPDRALGERLHAIIKASAPVLAETLVRDLSVYSTTSVSTSIISNADNCSQSCGLSLSNG